MQLRPARPDELEFLYETRKAAFRYYLEWDDTRHRAEAYAEFAALPVQIIEQDDRRIGYIVVERHADHWFIDEIALGDGERDRGVGTALMRSTMDAARAANVPLRLSVRDNNPVRRLYERLGFRVTRIEPPRIKMEWP